MPAGRRIEKGDDSEKPCGCLPNKAKDYDVIDLPYDRERCKKEAKHDLELEYELASQGMLGAPSIEPQEQDTDLQQLFGSLSEPQEPVHVVPQSFVDQLRMEVLNEKRLRKRVNFPNYLAQLGRTGSYQWPSQYVMGRPIDLKKTNYFSTTKQTEVQPVYESIHRSEVPDNAYRYMYTLHREDRRHAKNTGLHINKEEMSRPKPGILVNSDYGRRNQDASKYPDERHHNVYAHKTFSRNRGDDAN